LQDGTPPAKIQDVMVMLSGYCGFPTAQGVVPAEDA